MFTGNALSRAETRAPVARGVLDDFRRLLPRDRLAPLQPHEALRDLCAEMFVRLGLPPEDAVAAADGLVVADLRGVHSHGVARMEIYVRRLELGLFNPRPRIRVERTGASVAVVDGDNGMGAVVATRCARLASDIAAETGVGVVTARSSNHYGAAAHYLSIPLARNQIGITCSNAPPTTAVHGGREAVIGTNPLGFAVPAGSHSPIVGDLATSAIARGKIALAHKRGEAIPEGLAVDREGRPTTDAGAALEGALLTFGGHKGSALAILVETLAGALSGAKMLRQIPEFFTNFETPSGFGHFFLTIDVSRFMDVEMFLRRVDLMISMLKACPPAAGFEEILTPGERSGRMEAERRRDGIPLAADTTASLDALARRLNVAALGER